MPMLPDAPGLFSTTSFCASRSDSFSAVSRAIASATPPAGQGTVNLIGWLGQASARTLLPAARRRGSVRRARRLVFIAATTLPQGAVTFHAGAWWETAQKHGQPMLYRPCRQPVFSLARQRRDG